MGRPLFIAKPKRDRRKHGNSRSSSEAYMIDRLRGATDYFEHVLKPNKEAFFGVIRRAILTP